MRTAADQDGSEGVTARVRPYTLEFGGGRGIRTPGTLPGTVVFKTTALNRSAIPPRHDFSKFAIRLHFTNPRTGSKIRPQCCHSYLVGVVDLPRTTAPEPSKRFFEPLTVFKTACFNHSHIPPARATRPVSVVELSTARSSRLTTDNQRFSFAPAPTRSAPTSSDSRRRRNASRDPFRCRHPASRQRSRR